MGKRSKRGRHKTHEGARDGADASWGLETTRMESIDRPIVCNRALQRSRQKWAED